MDNARIKKDYESPGIFAGAFAALARGDIWVRLTLLVWGLGYLARKQIVKGVAAIALEAISIYFIIAFALPEIGKLDRLGTVRQEYIYNKDTMKNEYNDYDNSFLILLFGIASILIIATIAIILVSVLSESYELQRKAEAGKPINSLRQDFGELLDRKFHLTLLFLPSLGIILFTVIPIIFMILIAFTNYDRTHLPPGELFTWVGFENFKKILAIGSTDAFGYTFGKILIWTLVWAFFSTFTCYVGGILLSLLINNRHTRAKKLWRTLFMIAIAVPQFVSLLLVRNFFRNSGIVNTLLSRIGVTEFLGRIGLVDPALGYIPFLTDANWLKVMLILINIWIGVPYLMLIASGVLMNIPAELYESAKIDGANGYQTFKKITMPYMLSVTGPYLITSFIGNINNFNVIYLLTKDVFTTNDQRLANARAMDADLLITWLYKLTRDFMNYKMASVIGILIFIICTVFTLIAFNWTLRGDKEETFQL